MLQRASFQCAKLTSLDVSREDVDPARSAVCRRGPFICHSMISLFRMSSKQEATKKLAYQETTDPSAIYSILRYRAADFPTVRKYFVLNTTGDPFTLQPHYHLLVRTALLPGLPGASSEHVDSFRRSISEPQ